MQLRLSLAIALLALAPLRAPAGEPPLSALLIGGGANPASNVAQIESHLRYAASLLPPAASRRLLFYDGQTDAETVTISDDSAAGRGKRALLALLPNSGLDTPVATRKPDLGARIDGPANREAFHRAFTELAPKAHGAAGPPLLLYFAGHGTRNDTSGEVTYNCCNNETLSPRDLAIELARVGPKTPVALVMAQCYSGAFGDVLFHHAEPNGDPSPLNLAGFFSARSDRTASGCGAGTAAADYQDFSSYFFGALCGRDRFGRPVAGADFNGDGRVSLHEAFCWALARDDSFDTPVCTSDVFLERFAALPDAAIFSLPYSEIRGAATPGQRAALEALSARLGLAGEHRARDAFDRLAFEDPIGRPAQIAADRKSADDLAQLRETALRPLLKSWPALRWNPSADFDAAVDQAAGDLTAQEALAGRIIAASQARDAAGADLDNEEGWLLRFTDLCRAVARARDLRAHGEAAVKARFERLREAEDASWPLTARPQA